MHGERWHRDLRPLLCSDGSKVNTFGFEMDAFGHDLVKAHFDAADGHGLFAQRHIHPGQTVVTGGVQPIEKVNDKTLASVVFFCRKTVL